VFKGRPDLGFVLRLNPNRSVRRATPRSTAASVLPEANNPLSASLNPASPDPRDFRQRPAKFRRSALAGGGETLKRSGFPEVPTFSGWRSSCPCGWRASRVSSSSLFDRADAGIWAKRQPAVQGLVSRHHVHGVPASGLHDVRKRERPRQLQKRRRRGRGVCSRRRAAHRCCSGCAERPRCSSVPVGPSAY
jgi:hypothetical protein